MMCNFLFLLSACFGLSHASLSTGDSHAGAVQANGEVYTWGQNKKGELGDGTLLNRIAPVKVIGLGNVSSLSCGLHFSCFVNSEALLCTGGNDLGQLGDGSTSNRLQPNFIASLTSHVKQVSSGVNHACAVLTSGGVRCWGRNSAGQLATGTLGGFSVNPVEVVGFSFGGAISVSAGARHTCVLTETGEVYCAGADTYGQLGNDEQSIPSTEMVPVFGLHSVEQIECGYYHTCALLAPTGEVRCWGRGIEGQLGNSLNSNSFKPITPHGLFPGVVVRVMGGYAHTCVIFDTGTARCFGLNDLYGQLGTGDKVNSNVPVSFGQGIGNIKNIDGGYSFTCAQFFDGSVQCVGEDKYGQLGDGFPKEDSVVLVPVRDLPATNSPTTRFPSFSPLESNCCACQPTEPPACPVCEICTLAPSSLPPSLPPTNHLPTRSPIIVTKTPSKVTKSPSHFPSRSPIIVPTKVTKSPSQFPTKQSKTPTLLPSKRPSTSYPTSRRVKTKGEVEDEIRLLKQRVEELEKALEEY